jgi:plastocyanin
MKTINLSRPVACILIAFSLLLSCSKNSGDLNNVTTSGTLDSADSGENPTRVVIKNSAYSPNYMVVNLGTVVTFSNEDNMSHTVTTDAGPYDAFDSRSIPPGGRYLHAFNYSDTIKYHCAEHPNMKGVVIVNGFPR